MLIKGILIYYHCGSNTGYAIGRHEPDFLQMAIDLTGNINKVHIGYTDYFGGFPIYLDPDFRNLIEFDSRNKDHRALDSIYNYIRANDIEVAFGYDQPVSCPAYKAMRKAGVKLLISYWGAPVSSLNKGPKLFLKRMEVKMRKYKPDHYIFQSKAMADTAIYGRGIESHRVSIIPNAVDTEIYRPNPLFEKYAHTTFNIPENRKIVFFSGHMEERKGVQVIVKAAYELTCIRKRSDVHFLFLGNINGEEERFYPLFAGSDAEQYITFGGYRDDVNLILPSCYMGVIATIGWDSFTMSAIEMTSSGLPLIVSNLQGLTETIENNKSGFLIEPGDHISLANKIELLLDNSILHKSMSINARKRAIDKFSHTKHMEVLTTTMSDLFKAVAHK